jgi:two-component system, NarL family, response regulator LiaR
VKKVVVLYGIAGALVVATLRLVEYRWLVLRHAIEIYGALVALLFAALGIWLGMRLTRPPVVVVREVAIEVPVEVPVPVAAPAAAWPVDPARLERLGITPREHEILQLVAQGLSTREIAGRLSVSENTVKTHTSRLLTKLDARRRTQAVQRAKEAGIIP